MKYVDEYRDRDAARTIAAVIRREARTERNYRFMEFCGGHTHAIFRFGINDLVPGNVEFVHGPGCPVCVLPSSRIDGAIELVERHDVILCTYGDVMRVPAGGRRSLLTLKAEGGDIRMVYSLTDALDIARKNSSRQVVFFAIGFETTTPPTAVAVKQARAQKLNNFSIHCNHVLTPAAIRHLIASPEYRELGSVEIDGFLGPSHVSTIIGLGPYEFVARDYKKPVVIAGFEPLDVMLSTQMLIRQINENRHEVENEYTRAVSRDGNQKAQALVREVFTLRKWFEWRGLHHVANSALRLRDTFAEFDAEKRFTLSQHSAREVKGCDCPRVLRGAARPTDCKLFGTVCTPDNPMGACMVSSEGACAAHWRYGRHRKTQGVTV